MTTISMNIKGLKQLRSDMRKYGVRADKAVVQSLKDEAEGILKQSQELVPVDTGALRDSGRVVGPRKRSVTIEYGDDKVNYAAAVHEILDAFHPSGMAKFLEIPARRALVGMGKRMAKDVRNAVGGKK